MTACDVDDEGATGSKSPELALANELSEHRIRVNTDHPTGVMTNLSGEVGLARASTPCRQPPEHRSLVHERAAHRAGGVRGHRPRGRVLGFDEARYVTCLELKVDAGVINH
jgi:NAD(P)-dependent dehydrogenase (short-subunit alcohol dehydrogenase family)